MSKVIVLGGSGMLGSMVADYLSRDSKLEVAATTRTEELAAIGRERLSNVSWQLLDAAAMDPGANTNLLQGYDWAVNAIGIIKPLIHDDNAFEVERAIRVNALFPHTLARLAVTSGTRVLQIATDCVYAGTKGRYVEQDAHDPIDVYGKTKSLGEVYADTVHHLRCSIIGPEFKEPKSLLEWFLGQPHAGTVNGFTNHRWNGVTTLHFAKLCHGIITQEIPLPHLQHITAREEVTKYEMLQFFARSFGREDLTINSTEAAVLIDRTLSTTDEGLNNKVWTAAGYSQPPTVPDMLSELAAYNYGMSPRRLDALVS